MAAVQTVFDVKQNMWSTHVLHWALWSRAWWWTGGRRWRRGRRSSAHLKYTSSVQFRMTPLLRRGAWHWWTPSLCWLALNQGCHCVGCPSPLRPHPLLLNRRWTQRRRLIRAAQRVRILCGCKCQHICRQKKWQFFQVSDLHPLPLLHPCNHSDTGTRWFIMLVSDRSTHWNAVHSHYNISVSKAALWQNIKKRPSAFFTHCLTSIKLLFLFYRMTSFLLFSGFWSLSILTAGNC